MHSYSLKPQLITLASTASSPRPSMIDSASIRGQPFFSLWPQVACAAWCVIYMLPKPIAMLMKSSVGTFCFSVTYETMRCHVLIGSAGIGAKSLATFVSGTYPVPIVAPLVRPVLPQTLFYLDA